MWDKMKMGNAIKAVRSEENGMQKTSKVYEVPRSTLKKKGKSRETYRETDQYATCLETRVALQS